MGSKFLAFACFFLCFQGILAAINVGKFVSPDEFDQKDTLVFLQTVWRHGARTPTFTFPADPNKKWERGWGELTLEGMAQHFVLGGRLNDRYVNTINFFSKNYSSEEIYVRSTDVNRTILSATSNLIGFFKDVKEGIDYPENVAWPKNYLPIPIHTPSDFIYDYVGNPLSFCKRANAIITFMKECPEVQKIANESKDLLAELSRITKENVTIWNVWSVYDAWFIDWQNNKTLPEGFTEARFNQTGALNNKMDNIDYGIGISPYKHFDAQLELKKLRGGPTLWSIIEHFQAKKYCDETPKEKRDANGKNLCKWLDNLKYYAYSAHDITIAGLFATFDFNETNFDEPGFPHYSACVSLELWKNPKSEYYIKVFYWVPPNDTVNWTGEQLIDLTKNISGCTDECGFDKFVDRSKKYKLTDKPDKACEDTKLIDGAFVNVGSLFTTLFCLIISLFRPII